jgi:hypothetical protein
MGVVPAEQTDGTPAGLTDVRKTRVVLLVSIVLMYRGVLIGVAKSVVP